VYVERRGELEPTSVRFRDNDHLLRIVNRIAAAWAAGIDESSPMVDARLPDGSRVNAAISPIAIDGAAVSIRKFSKKPYNLEKLVEFGAMPACVAEFLHGRGLAGLHGDLGGTGSGKTTLLNALSAAISHKERTITIEDAAELQMQQPHVVRMETRPPNIEGKGEIRQRELVKNALRMRPDRVILGEVRGEEAFDMLQAMNTGHEGSMATIHANNPREAGHPPGADGGHGRLQLSQEVRARPDRLGRRPDRAGEPPFGRQAQGHQRHRDHRHGRLGDPDAGDLRLPPAAPSRRHGARRSARPGLRPRCLDDGWSARHQYD
jgi:type IV secretory pathway ATPase VirB11/archaellum biosynthesis ATPase